MPITILETSFIYETAEYMYRFPFKDFTISRYDKKEGMIIVSCKNYLDTKVVCTKDDYLTLSKAYDKAGF